MTGCCFFVSFKFLGNVMVSLPYDSLRFELAVRFMAFESKRDCLRDAWFIFDSVLAPRLEFSAPANVFKLVKLLF